jgi:hypothetical protein
MTLHPARLPRIFGRCSGPPAPPDGEVLAMVVQKRGYRRAIDRSIVTLKAVGVPLVRTRPPIRGWTETRSWEPAATAGTLTGVRSLGGGRSGRRPCGPELQWCDTRAVPEEAGECGGFGEAYGAADGLHGYGVVGEESFGFK